jgi:hypothetical protein
MRIGSCADLGAPGKWQKINPPDAHPASTFDDGLTGDVRTDPIDSGTVYVGVKGFAESFFATPRAITFSTRRTLPVASTEG